MHSDPNRLYTEIIAADADEWADGVSSLIEESGLTAFIVNGDEHFANIAFFDAIIMSAVNSIIEDDADAREIVSRLVGVVSAVAHKAQGSTLLERFTGPIDDHVPEGMA